MTLPSISRWTGWALGLFLCLSLAHQEVSRGLDASIYLSEQPNVEKSGLNK